MDSEVQAQNLNGKVEEYLKEELLVLLAKKTLRGISKTKKERSKTLCI